VCSSCKCPCYNIAMQSHASLTSSAHIDCHKSTQMDRSRWHSRCPGTQFSCLLHRMGVINRDIKLENILLVYYEGRPFLKMCDFGYSINQNHSLPVTAVGTPGYTGMWHHLSCYSCMLQVQSMHNAALL